MGQVSGVLDKVSEALSCSVYMAETTNGNVSTKAVGFETKTGLNILKGDLFTSGKIMLGGEMSVKSANGKTSIGNGTLFIEGTIGLKDGKMCISGRLVGWEVTSTQQAGGVSVSESFVAGLSGGIEIGAATWELELAPGVGGSIELTADLNDILGGN